MERSMRWILIGFLLIVVQPISAQFKFEYNGGYPVWKDTKKLVFPWTGGLNVPQFSTIDYDYDGDLDLIVFDRSSHQLMLFKNEGNEYSFVPNGELLFPNDLRYRLACIDYNGDGQKDLFTYGVGGIKVYRNIGNSIDGLQWDLASAIINSQYVGSYTNLYVSSSDIPAYVDVDGDGDIDVLTFHISGERLEYHQNQSMELYGHSDSLIFELKNECWGKFTEDPNGFELILDAQVSPCNSPNLENPQRPSSESESQLTLPSKTRHSGSTILALDMDNSSTIDLILGDVSYNNLIYLRNGGTAPNTNSAMVFQDVNFPSGTFPAHLTEFPAAFWEDVDFDGVKDLIVAPNAKGTSDNQSAILRYKNIGTNQLPTFEYVETGFFQNEMIDVGTGAIPSFFDVNGDGLYDLIVSNQYKSVSGVRSSSLTFYKNVGTSTSPVFEFVTDDYLGLAQNWNLGLRLVPCFGDVDGDQKPDLILGTESGRIYYCKNNGIVNGMVAFAAPTTPLEDEEGVIIQLNGFVYPQLWDVNKDGELDLIIGKQSGELIYYEHIGNQKFKLVSSNFGSIDSELRDNFPSFQMVEYLDTTYLFLGGLGGGIKKFSAPSNALTSSNSFELNAVSFLGLSIGAYSSPAIIDIDQDTNLDLFLGSELGGILHYEHDENSTVTVTEIETSPSYFFPNPSNGIFSFSGILNFDEIILFDHVGRKVEFEILEGKITIINPISGIYFLQFKKSSTQLNEYYRLIIE